MKKFLSILLALALVLSLGTVAFATGGEPYTDHKTVTLTKNYKLTNEDTTSPAETFTFTEPVCTDVEDVAQGVDEADAPTPTIAGVKFSEGAAGDSANGTQTITIDLPDVSEYPSVGVYTYTFEEKTGTTAGVEYSTQEIELKVYILNDENGNRIRVPSITTKGTDEKKLSSIENTYSAGSLAVTKEVTGNLGDKQKDFNVTVTFTVPEGKTVNSEISYTDGESKTIAPANWSNNTATAVIALKDGETVTFTNIPYDVTYTVVEDNYEAEDYITEYNFEDTAKKIDSKKDTVTITNDKNVEGVIDTGVFMDSLPYVLLLVGACAGLVVFLARRRMTHKG